METKNIKLVDNKSSKDEVVFPFLLSFPLNLFDLLYCKSNNLAFKS